MTNRFVPAATSMLVAVSLMAAACSDADTPALGDGSLGFVTVGEGEAIQIRSVSTIGHDDAGARDYVHVVETAIEDYGPIHGRFTVDLGNAIDDGCSADDGPRVAEEVLADDEVVGVIGTSCSATATTAVPLITAAGMVVISMSNSSPLLTSDLAGNPAQYYQQGYYRTCQNDLYQGEAVSAFLHNTIRAQSTAVVHEGDAYTKGLAQAFRTAFERRGGTVTDFIEINPDSADLAEVLTRLASGNPDALYFPLTEETAAEFIVALRRNGEFEDTVLASGDGVIHDTFLALDESRGVFVSGPDLEFGGNTNQATGVDAQQAADRFSNKTGAPPNRAFWAHAYDATTLLLDAVTAASRFDGRGLVIDRAGIRQYLNQVGGYQGLIGDIDCDAFGDCGSGKIAIIEHLNPADTLASRDNVVYRFSPQTPATDR